MQYNFLVIGETCTDKFVYGKVARMSPEAPVPVFIPLSTVTNDGMGGNVLNNLLAIIKNNNQNHSVYSIIPDSSCLKTRFVDLKTNHYFLRVDENDSFKRLEFSDPELNTIAKSDCIIISDYDKGFIKEEDIKRIRSLVREDTLIFLDTKKRISKDLLRYVNFVKLNESEYLQNFPNELKLLYYDKLVVTLGEKGAKYLDVFFEQENPKTTYDVSGAGDTFTAALAYHYTVNKNIPEAIRYANSVAAQVVTKKGVSTI
jgi:bifunctional ADP-heptose synthase (sugar kinase/adenylyltransferase)